MKIFLFVLIVAWLDKIFDGLMMMATLDFRAPTALGVLVGTMANIALVVIGSVLLWRMA